MKAITALIGPNEAFKQDYLKKILRNISQDDITVYYADEADPKTIFLQCSQDSLFGANHIVVVKNIAGMAEKIKRDFEEELEKYLEQVNPATNLILLAEKFGADLLSKIRDNGDVFEFRKPYRNELIKFIKEKLDSAKIGYAEELPDFLIALANEETEDIDMMIQMMVHFAQKTKSISIEDAKSLLARSNNMDIFDLLEGIFKRDLRKALTSLEDLKLTGDPVTKITYMILRTAKNLWGYLSLKNKSDASGELKIKPFEAKILGEYARYSDMKFVSSVLELARTVEMKTKSMSEDFAYLEIETFILNTAKAGQWASQG